MAVQLELSSERPGHGRLVIRNLVVEGEVRFSFLRHDGSYLGPEKHWQETPHWHVVSGVVAEGNNSGCLLGSDIIDGLLLSSGSTLQVSVQGGSSSGEGRMRIMGRLLGSNAAGSFSETVSMTQAVAGSAVAETGVPEPELAEETQPEPEPSSLTTPTLPTHAQAASRNRWLGVLLVLVLLGALAGAWYFGLLKLPGLPGSGGSLEPVAEEAPTVADNTEAHSPVPSLKGRPRAQSYLATDERPTPQAMFDQAATWENEGDCEAAMIVYQMAAQDDTGQAARYAHRYDPDGFSASKCINSPDAETAAYWYESPAGAGDVDAQRQLGKILVEKYTSGAMRDRGESWLKRAAQSGDESAQQLIKKLGIGDE